MPLVGQVEGEGIYPYDLLDPGLVVCPGLDGVEILANRVPHPAQDGRLYPVGEFVEGTAISLLTQFTHHIGDRPGVGVIVGRVVRTIQVGLLGPVVVVEVEPCRLPLHTGCPVVWRIQKIVSKRPYRTQPTPESAHAVFRPGRKELGQSVLIRMDQVCLPQRIGYPVGVTAKTPAVGFPALAEYLRLAEGILAILQPAHLIHYVRRAVGDMPGVSSPLAFIEPGNAVLLLVVCKGKEPAVVPGPLPHLVRAVEKRYLLGKPVLSLCASGVGRSPKRLVRPLKLRASHGTDKGSGPPARPQAAPALLP